MSRELRWYDGDRKCGCRSDYDREANEYVVTTCAEHNPFPVRLLCPEKVGVITNLSEDGVVLLVPPGAELVSVKEAK